MPQTSTEFVQRFDQILRSRYGATHVRVTWEEPEHRVRSMTYLSDDHRSEAPPEPVLKPEAPAAPLAQPEPQEADEGKEGPVRVRCLPDPEQLTVGRKFSDELIGVAKGLLRRGQRPCEVAKRTGMSPQQVNSLVHDRVRRAVPIATEAEIRAYFAVGK